ncbi:MAG: ATP-dependent 6-phosphofructokinase [Firmicutes bacterium]|nr:ATP-dependent 6-phosphofructokinase [Bacillota bacterium]
MSKKICILGSGGDAPGMNACVESVYREGKKRGWTVVGCMSGYDGLVLERFVQLNDAAVTNIGSKTGCVLKAGRSEVFMTDEGLKRAIDNVKKHGFAAVIVLGGNGSLKGAWDRLHVNGVPVVGVPCTIDNDVFFTNNSLGFSSAAEESVRLVDNLNGTMMTNDRDHVVQLMGRNCEKLADLVGVATFADIIDVEHDRHTAVQVATIFDQNRKRGQTSNIMIMQEKKSTDVITEAMDTVKFQAELSNALGSSRIRMTTLGHLQRGAAPSARDRWLGAMYGKKVVEQIEANQLGVAVGLVGEYFIAHPIEKVGKNKR